MRLNGWQRLWIVLSFIYLCAIIAYCYSVFPYAEKIEHKDEFYRELSKKSYSVINNCRAGLLELLKENETFSITMPNEHTIIVFSNKVKKIDFEDATKEYWSLIEKKVNVARIHLIQYALFIWLAPCIALYILGHAINWVYRGFKS